MNTHKDMFGKTELLQTSAVRNISRLYVTEVKKEFHGAGVEEWSLL